MNTKDFENRFMQLIGGQMPLPQSIFRQFLDWLQGQESADMSTKQDATDESLETTNKTIAKAINEVNTLAGNALPAANITYDGTEYLLITVGFTTYKVAATPVESEE